MRRKNPVKYLMKDQSNDYNYLINKKTKPSEFPSNEVFSEHLYDFKKDIEEDHISFQQQPNSEQEGTEYLDSLNQLSHTTNKNINEHYNSENLQEDYLFDNNDVDSEEMIPKQSSEITRVRDYTIIKSYKLKHLFYTYIIAQYFSQFSLKILEHNNFLLTNSIHNTKNGKNIN
jgi:hypothetical protein